MNTRDPDHPDTPLTDQENRVLNLLAKGLSDREIAETLVISVGTVKWYNRQIYSKLHVSSRTQAVAEARRAGLLDGSLETDKSPPNPPSHNLPVRLTPFIGRTQELHDLTGLLKQTRLVTITGAGGIGKTRLALEFAFSQTDQFPDGVYLIPLAAINNDENLIWAIAEALHFQFHRDKEAVQQLLEYFQHKKALLVFDNFEHVLGGAGLVPQILKAAEAVHIIVTSRERLSVYGEVTYAVRGLTLQKKAGDVQQMQSEAVELFVDRATATLPGWKMSSKALRYVERICALVEGMPLGIELAATWVDTLSVAEITSEIERSLDILQTEWRDAAYGHNSIRATFIRSWDSLTKSQQTAFCRLSVFRGGFDRQAASAIAEVDIQTLRALVSKSLLRHDAEQGRYDFHELLRYFGLEKLEESGEASFICDSHASYYARLVDRNWQRTNDQYQALLCMEADIENIRVAWQHSLKIGAISQLKMFFHGVWSIYDMRGWYPAGLRLFEQAIHSVRSLPGAEAEAAVGWMMAAESILTFAGEFYGSRRAYQLAQKSVAILRRLGQYEDMILPLISLFVSAHQVGENEVAAQAAHECLAIATQTNNQWGLIKAQHILALQAVEDKEYAMARQLAANALHICGMVGERWCESAICIEVMATVAIVNQDYDSAQQWLLQGLHTAQAIQFKHGMQLACFQLGYVAALQGDFTQSAHYWHKALKVSDRLIGGVAITGFFGKATTGDYDL